MIMIFCILRAGYFSPLSSIFLAIKSRDQNGVDHVMVHIIYLSPFQCHFIQFGLLTLFCYLSVSDNAVKLAFYFRNSILTKNKFTSEGQRATATIQMLFHL